MTAEHVRCYMPHDVVSVARLEGDPQALLLALASEVRGYVGTCYGRVTAALLGCEIPNPWRPGRSDFLAQGLYGEAAQFRSLLDHLSNEAAARGWLAVRIQLPADFGHLALFDGWEFSHLDVVRELHAAEVAHLPGYRVRPAGVADADLVLAWTADAIQQGMTSQERVSFSGCVMQAARRRIRSILGGTFPLVVVAEDPAGEPVGHALADLVDCEPEPGLGICSHLHDVYVTPEHQGRGVAKYLSEFAQGKALEADIRRMSATVCGSPTENEALLSELTSQGWRVSRQTWVRVAN